MTAEEATTLALARAREFSEQVTANRALAYWRLGKRQAELFSLVAQASPDYFGVCARAALSGGAVDLTDVADPVPGIEHLQRVEVYDPGTHPTLLAGDEIHLVPLQDPEVSFPPRMTLRDRVLRAVGSDLDGVAELRIYYARTPLALGPASRDTALEIPDPFLGLLIVDLARDLVRRSGALPPAERSAHIALLDAEEASELQAFLAHTASFAGPLESRFARDRQG